jgi:GAF domain-containing protein
MDERTFRPVLIICSVVGAALMAGASFYGCAWEPTATGIVLIAAGCAFIAVPQIVLHAGRIRAHGLAHRDRALQTLTDLTSLLLELPESIDPRVTLLTVDTSYKTPTLHAVARSAKGDGIPSSAMTIHEGVAGKCYRRGEVVVQHEVPDFLSTMRDLGFTDEEARQFKPDRQSYACVPVMDGSNNVLAVLSLDANRPNAYDPPHVEVAENIAPFFARLLTVKETIED